MVLPTPPSVCPATFVNDQRSHAAPWSHIDISCLISDLIWSIMTQHSTGDFTSMFQDGKLTRGIYKIQNVGSNYYVDTSVYSKNVCTRLALEDGAGLVCLYLPSAAHEPDIQKWEIKPLGAGYTMRKVRLLI